MLLYRRGLILLLICSSQIFSIAERILLDYHRSKSVLFVKLISVKIIIGDIIKHGAKQRQLSVLIIDPACPDPYMHLSASVYGKIRIRALCPGDKLFRYRSGITSGIKGRYIFRAQLLKIIVYIIISALFKLRLHTSFLRTGS